MSLTILSLILKSSLFLKFVIFFLTIVLIWAWGIFIEKFGIFKLKLSLSESFKREFDSGEMLDKIYNRLSEKKKIYSPLARVFFVGMKELNMSNIRNIDFSARYSDSIKKNIRDRIYSSMAIERIKIIKELKSGLSYFILIIAITPFVGLLGTIWEIMSTFYSVNASKVVNLSMIIPGIAQSLISIIFAILITLLSIFFYNFLTIKLNHFIQETEIFAHDLTNILARELDILTNNASKRVLQERRSKSNSIVTSDDEDDDDI
jgi:biopolymer transport protein TolQ